MCERFPSDVLLDWRQGRLAADVAEHVPHCQLCQAELQELEQWLDVAARDVIEPSAGADAFVRNVIRKRVDDRPALREGTRSDKANRGARRRWQLVASTVASAAVMLMIGLMWFGPKSSAPVLGTLVMVPEGVMLHRDGQQHAAASGMTLRASDTLSVPVNHTATVSLTDGMRAELGPLTTLVFERDELVLREGFLELSPESVSSTARDDSNMRGASRQSARHTVRQMVRTPSARAAVRETTFSLGVDEHRTCLRVAAGEVAFTRLSDGQTVEVAAGQRLVINADADLRPTPSRTGTVLQIVSDDDRFPQWAEFNRLVEAQFSQRLWRLGFRVETRRYDDVRAEDLVNRPLVIVSIFESDVGAADALRRIKLADADVPVLCFEPDGFPVLGMTGPEIRVDHGFDKRGLFVVDFPNPHHPLSAGLKGEDVELFRSRLGNLGWGRPAGDAVIAVQLAGQPTKAVVFGYEAGGRLLDRNAPARRVGMFLDPDQVQTDSQTAWRLFEAAVEWCVQERPQPAVAKLKNSWRGVT